MNIEMVYGAANRVYDLLALKAGRPVRSSVDLAILGEAADEVYRQQTTALASAQGIMLLAYRITERDARATLLLFRLSYAQAFDELSRGSGNHMYLAAAVNQIVETADRPKMAERIVVKDEDVLEEQVNIETEGRVFLSRQTLANSIVWQCDEGIVRTGVVDPRQLSGMTILLGVNVADGFPKWVIPHA